MSPVEIATRPHRDATARAESAVVVETRRAIRYPASLAQQRFWVLDKLEPHNPALNVAVRWRIEGNLPVELIEKAFAQIVERHEALRTAFVEIDGEPFQIVQPEVTLRVPSIDLTVLPEADALVECDRVARAEATTLFDLASAPLIRVTHVRVRPDVAIVLVTAHHAVCDGWSIGVLAHEMGAICAALQAGHRPDLPDLPVTYGDYAAWQREEARDGFAQEVAYWSGALDGLEFFELPTDFPRRSAQGSVGAIESQLLGRPLTDQLAVVAQQNGCTLFMVAYAALATLLHRYTGATDIAVGTQVAGRDQVETEDVVGLFINALVLRADLTGEPNFLELLERARGVIVEALEHQAMPFQRVIEILSPKRHSGHNPVFSINFILQRSFIENVDYGPFRLVDLPSRSAGALFDLNFFMVERPDGWRLSCEYNTDLFEPNTVQRMLGHFQTLLEGIVANPGRRLWEFSLLTEAERQRQLVEWNQTVEHPQNKLIHQLLEDQAKRTPTAVAVTYQNESLTYADLNAKANRLARRLVGMGVKPDDRVAICVERSLDTVVGVLAILKAGGAYVPMDTVYPADRLAYMLEDSAPVAVLTHEPAQAALEKAAARLAAPPPVLDLNDQSAFEEAGNLDPAEIGLNPRHLAYIIYTSGSTGKPKGVMIEHRNVVRLFEATNPWFHFGQDDVWTLFHSFAFDFSVWEIWGALLYGGRLVVVPRDVARSPNDLYRLLHDEGITVFNQTPSSFYQYIASNDRIKQPKSLRLVIFGGETLDASKLRPVIMDPANRSVRLINMYGITETTVHVTYYPITAKDAEKTGPSPVGRPIPDLRFYILDPHGKPAPTGTVGEVYVGGAGVARGYLNRPELSSERFIPNPFHEGDRLYKSGDLARYLPDGSIEFFGRNDSQVKIRGFRIELGEIEARLLQHPGLSEVSVVVREDTPGDKRLAAYYTVLPGAAAPTSERLRAGLSASLPGYMVPAAYVRLDALPLTANGKVDRKALPRPSLLEEPKSGSWHPKDDLEIRLAQIWCEILGVKSVDATSDFFDLGGHSLLAVRLLARVEAVFERRIGLAALFGSSGFRAFANLLRSLPAREFDFRHVVRMGARHAERSIFAINNTGVFLTLAKCLDENLSITALQLFDPLIQRESLPTTVEETAREYAELIREIQPTGPYALIGWCSGGALAFETARQLEEAGEVVSDVFVIDTWIPSYLRRLGWLRSNLADYTYRWQLILLDWARFRARQKSFWDFIADRAIVRRFYRRGRDADVAAEPVYAAAQAYDHWLLGYTEKMLKSYEPKPITAQLTVLRSASEPAGRFLDPKLGWGGMAASGVDLVVIPGDHYTVFKEPHVLLMAKPIGAALRPPPRTTDAKSKIVIQS